MMLRSNSRTHRFHWFVAVVALLLAACGGGGDGVTGPPGVVDSLVLNLESTELELEDTTRLVAVARDANGSVVSGVQFTWTSSDPSVATVSTDGLVTAVDLGEAAIDVEVAPAARRTGARMEAPSLVVTPQRRGASRALIRTRPRVVITPGATDADLGGSVGYAAEAYGPNGAPLRIDQIAWSSSNPAVATIDPASGQASAVARGTTMIGVTVSVGPFLDYRPRRVPLRVVVCGGISEVEEWDATVSVRYNVISIIVPSGGDPARPTTFIVNQESAVTARLTKSVSVGNDNGWKGEVTGTGKVNSSMSAPQHDGPPIVNTEIGEGDLIPSAYGTVELFAFHFGGECVFAVRYQDNLGYTQTIYPFGPLPRTFGTTGVAWTDLQAIGPRTSQKWDLGVEVLLPAYVAVSPNNSARPEGDTEGKPGYWLVTPIGAAMFAAQRDPHASLGEATFKFKLVER